MKKTVCLAALAAVCVLLSGCMAVHAADDKPTSGYINENLTVKSGYYTREIDDSYIHVDGNMIELCNLDYYADAEDHWNKLMDSLDAEERERQSPNHDIFIENTVQLAKEFDTLRKFVVYIYPLSTYQPEKSDLTTLVLDYELLKKTGTISGYNYNEDGSISRGELTYYYVGEELPV